MLHVELPGFGVAVHQPQPRHWPPANLRHFLFVCRLGRGGTLRRRQEARASSKLIRMYALTPRPGVWCLVAAPLTVCADATAKPAGQAPCPRSVPQDARAACCLGWVGQGRNRPAFFAAVP